MFVSRTVYIQRQIMTWPWNLG